MACLVWQDLSLTCNRTLSSMFPNLDRDVIEDVVKVKGGRYVQLLSFFLSSIRVPVMILMQIAMQSRSSCGCMSRAERGVICAMSYQNHTISYHIISYHIVPYP